MSQLLTYVDRESSYYPIVARIKPVQVGSWKELNGLDRTLFFSVPGVTDYNILNYIKYLLDKAVYEGHTDRWFINSIMEHTPKINISAKKLRLIYHNYTFIVYNTSRRIQDIENADYEPIWMYVSVMDQKTKYIERLLDRKSFYYTDPIWNIIYPPVCLGGRGRVCSYSESRAARRGITIDKARILKKITKDEKSIYGIEIDGKICWLDPKFSCNTGGTLNDSVFLK